MINENTRMKIGFIVASITITVLFIASSTAIPFYASYQTLYNIPNNIISFSTVVYFIGNVFSLIFLSKISNYLGRKPTIRITLILSILGCLSFIYVNNGQLLLLGRLLQGICCGMTAGSIQAYIIDTSPENSNIGVIIATNMPLIGFSIGAINSGVIVDYNPSLISTVFLPIILILIICIILISLGKETVTPKKGVIKSIKPEISIPHNIRKYIPITIIATISTYSITGFYQSFSSIMSLMQFGTNSKLIAAIVYANIMAPQILGSSLINHFGNKKGQKYGIIGFTACLVIINISLIMSWIIPFIISSILTAIFCGLTFTATMNNLVEKTSQEDMAGVLSTSYLITDGGTALVNMMISIIITYTTLINVSLLYLVFVIISCILTLKLSKNLSTKKENRGI